MERLWVRPPALKEGDRIGIISPSSKPDPTALEEGVRRLSNWGFRPVLAPHVLDQWGHLAGDDRARASDFQEFWADPSIRGIICSRGGDGAMALLPLIDWDVVRRSPKFFCGFSDITALHAALAQEAGLVTFHGPMPAAFGPEHAEAYNANWLRLAMTSRSPLGTIAWPAGDGAPQPLCIVPGTVRGRLSGGCLSLLVSLLGTRWAPDLAGTILLLEDTYETPARMERMLLQLLLSGELAKVSGILFAYSPDCEQRSDSKPSLHLFDILRHRLAPLGIPILYGFPAGHADHRATLPLGALAEMDATAGRLTILERALSE